MVQHVSGVGARVSEDPGPRFALALPAWIWFVLFFTLPVLWIVYYSFGYKPNIFHPIATDKLSLDTYHEALSGTFVHVFSQTLQISIIGHRHLLPDRVPVRILAGDPRDGAVAGPAARPGDRAVLRQLPRAHDRVVHPAVAGRPGLERAAELGAPERAAASVADARCRAARASSTTTWR